MSLLKINCDTCGNKINKINSIKDVFLIKSGRKIICKNCGSEYTVLNIIRKVGSFYNYLLIGGLSIFIWLLLTVLVGDILGKEMSNTLGIWTWALSAIVYIVLEYIVAIILPLKQIKD